MAAAIPEPLYKQFLVAGRRRPSANEENPRIYRMRVFAQNANRARSRFWYFMSQLNRINKTAGEVVACTQVSERHPGKIKNFGIWYRYDSRTGTHNAYKEFRDVTLTDAINAMFMDMAGRSRAKSSAIQILKTAELKPEECKR